VSWPVKTDAVVRVLFIGRIGSNPESTCMIIKSRACEFLLGVSNEVQLEWD
jgi:hypothetical protein